MLTEKIKQVTSDTQRNKEVAQKCKRTRVQKKQRDGSETYGYAKLGHVLNQAARQNFTVFCPITEIDSSKGVCQQTWCKKRYNDPLAKQGPKQLSMVHSPFVHGGFKFQKLK